MITRSSRALKVVLLALGAALFCPGMSAAQPPTSESAASMSKAWGLFSELAGKTWVITDTGAFNSFYVVSVRFEGELMISESVGYLFDREIPSRSALVADGQGRIGEPGKALNGTVLPDGSVLFETKGFFGQRKPLSSLRRINGEIVNVYAEWPKRPYVFNPISPEEVPALVATWRKRYEGYEQARIQESQARWAQFNATLQGVAAALETLEPITSANLAQSQSELDATLTRIGAQTASERSAAARASPPITPAIPRQAGAGSAIQDLGGSLPTDMTRYAPVNSGKSTGSWANAGTPRSGTSGAEQAADKPAGTTLITTPEAIFACTIPGSDGRFECDSPVTAGLEGSPKSLSQWRTPDLMVASMSSACPSPRRLQSSTHLVWGCGFGATNNSNSMDRSAGVDVQGRNTYYCSERQTSCRRKTP